MEELALDTYFEADLEGWAEDFADDYGVDQSIALRAIGRACVIHNNWDPDE